MDLRKGELTSQSWSSGLHRQVWLSRTLKELTNVFFRRGFAFLRTLTVGFGWEPFLVRAVGFHHLALLGGDDVLLFSGLLPG